MFCLLKGLHFVKDNLLVVRVVQANFFLGDFTLLPMSYLYIRR